MITKEQYQEFVARLRGAYTVYPFDRNLAFWHANNGYRIKWGVLAFETWQAFTEYKNSLQEPESKATPLHAEYLKKQAPAKIPDRIRQVFTHRKQ